VLDRLLRHGTVGGERWIGIDRRRGTGGGEEVGRVRRGVLAIDLDAT